MKHNYQKWAFRERNFTGYSRNGPLVCKFYRVGIKDGPTALKKNQNRGIFPPIPERPNNFIRILKRSVVSFLSSLYYSPDIYLPTASRGLTTLNIIKPYGIWFYLGCSLYV